MLPGGSPEAPRGSPVVPGGFQRLPRSPPKLRKIQERQRTYPLSNIPRKVRHFKAHFRGSPEAARGSPDAPRGSTEAPRTSQRLPRSSQRSPRVLTSAVMETVKNVYFHSGLGLIPGQTSRAHRRALLRPQEFERALLRVRNLSAPSCAHRRLHASEGLPATPRAAALQRLPPGQNRPSACNSKGSRSSKTTPGPKSTPCAHLRLHGPHSRNLTNSDTAKVQAKLRPELIRWRGRVSESECATAQ